MFSLSESPLQTTTRDLPQDDQEEEKQDSIRDEYKHVFLSHRRAPFSRHAVSLLGSLRHPATHRQAEAPQVAFRLCQHMSLALAIVIKTYPR